jgi:hypothetical protein
VAEHKDQFCEGGGGVAVAKKRLVIKLRVP